MAEQASLESRFNNQGHPAEKYIPTVSLKRCRRCKEFKPLEDFEKRNDTKRRRGVCNNCRSSQMSEYRQEHTEELTEKAKKYRIDHIEEYREYDRARYNSPKRRESFRIRSFLHGSKDTIRNNGTRGGFLQGTSICLICGEMYPLFLENHHVIPKDEMVIGLCSNCHRKYQSKQEKHMISVLNAIENSKFLWDSDGQPKGLNPVPMWTADLSLNGAINILKSYDLPGYEPIGVEV
ncbi:hypothetical protein KAX02_08700 [candidate division WOR-3 bacterium]|nr:hypothetical protein [candidate division WOR-3 bacterium]